MTNLTQKSMRELLSLNQGITQLFSGVASTQINGGADPAPKEWENFYTVLQLQEDIQNEIHSRIYQLIPEHELDSEKDTF